jgi:hypothetical protein
MEIKEIVYFDEPGPSNTPTILELAKKRIEALGIRHVVIASQAGVTVKRFLEITKDIKLDIVVVTNSIKGILISTLYSKYEESKRIKEDYKRKGITHFQSTISDEDQREFEKAGVKVFKIPDYINIGEPLGLDEEKKLEGSEAQWKLIRSKLSPFIPRHLRPLDIEAGMDLSLLTIISQGFRVSVGVTAVSVQNGFVPEGETVLSIAGTGFAGGGADTAVILRAHSNPKSCLVKEILGFPKLK